MAVSGGEDHWKREQERERDQSVGRIMYENTEFIAFYERTFGETDSDPGAKIFLIISVSHSSRWLFLTHSLSSCFKHCLSLPALSRWLVSYFTKKIKSVWRELPPALTTSFPHSPASVLRSLPSLLLERKYNVGSYLRQSLYLSPDPILLLPRLYIALQPPLISLLSVTEKHKDTLESLCLSSSSTPILSCTHSF